MVTKKKPKSTPKKVQTKTKANLKAKPKKSALRKTSVKKQLQKGTLVKSRQFLILLPLSLLQKLLLLTVLIKRKNT